MDGPAHTYESKVQPLHKLHQFFRVTSSECRRVGSLPSSRNTTTIVIIKLSRAYLNLILTMKKVSVQCEGDTWPTITYKNVPSRKSISRNVRLCTNDRDLSQFANRMRNFAIRGQWHVCEFHCFAIVSVRRCFANVQVVFYFFSRYLLDGLVMGFGFDRMACKEI